MALFGRQQYGVRCRSRRVMQRGYNIVEMGIALAVLGLLLGGALVPLQVRYEQEEINTTERYMEAAKKALLGYSQKNKTLARTIMYYDDVRYTIAAGRPYLPCPDINLDGLEDRLPMPAASETVVADPMLTTAGTCVEQKGVLPWKTLGVRDADSWGNYLIYRVDPAFSNALLGFDRSVRADVFSRLVALDETSGELRYNFHADRNSSAAIVCADFRNENNGGCPKTDLSNILAGVVTTVGIAVGARVIPPYDNIANNVPQGIVDGAVFVLLSHGKNGRGAINRSHSCQVGPAINVIDLVELANAYYRATHPFVANPDRVLNRVCDRPNPLPANATLQESLFVSAPIVEISNAERHQHDDIVTWIGRSELAGVLTRGGAYPLQRLEFLPE